MRRSLLMRRQLALAIGMTVACILVATLAGGLLMFVSDHDVLVISVITVCAGVLAAAATELIAKRAAKLMAAEEARSAAAERARRDLVAAASHDLRTPVAALRLLVDAVDDDLVDEQTRRRYQRTMQTHIEALSGLIDDLFELSRIEAGDIAWSMQQVQLAELVDETVEAMDHYARAKGVAISAELGDRRLCARADPEKVQRVLFNLVHNAIQHTPEDGSITIKATRLPDSDSAEIAISDTGTGIAADERSRVFEPFYRAGDDSSRKANGAGLGLAISRAIVEAHGGRIWLDRVDAGTSVRFTLPAAP